jgi:hypothetical protein
MWEYLVGLAIGIVLGWLSSVLIYRRMTPEEVWNRFLWALDRAERIPALRDAYEKVAAKAKDKLEEWLKLDWMK